MTYCLSPGIRAMAAWCLLSALSFCGYVEAATLTVCSSDCDYTSIAAAHAAAFNGDTIDIRDAVHTESGLVISKQLTITSTTPEPAVIQASPTPFVANQRIFNVMLSFPDTLIMDRLTLRHGAADEGGAMLVNGDGMLIIARVRFERNGRRDLTARGGAIAVIAEAGLTIIDSTFAENAATHGGGIHVNAGGVTISSSTFLDNDSFEGGGIRVDGGSLQVSNSTFFRNKAPNGAGGIFNNGGTTVVRSSTFSENTVYAVQSDSGQFVISNSVMANSMLTDGTPNPDCNNGVMDDGFNLMENTSFCADFQNANVINSDPRLIALGSWGGETLTMYPAPGSPVINNGSSLSGVDQRGVTRISQDDIGAVEANDPGEINALPGLIKFTVVANNGRFPVTLHQYGIARSDLAVRLAPTLAIASRGQVATYHGELDGDIENQAAAVIQLDGELFYQVVFSDGRHWINEGQATTVRSLSLSEVTPPRFVPIRPPQSIREADVGIDVPFHVYTQTYDSSIERTVRMVEYSLLGMNLVYWRQAGIEHRLGQLVIRTVENNDPYAGQRNGSNPHAAFLQTVESEWPVMDEDLVAVLREANGAAGLANLSAVGGTGRGYSSNDFSTVGDFSIVYRHEAGHNWSLDHFDGDLDPDDSIGPEGATINSANALALMSGPEAHLVVGFRDKRAAFLDDLGAASIPIPPHAATDLAFVSAQLAIGNQVSRTINVLANDHDANGENVEFRGVTLAPVAGNLGGNAIGQDGGVGYRVACANFNCDQPPQPSDDFAAFQYQIATASSLARGLLFVQLVNFADSFSQSFGGFANGLNQTGDGAFYTGSARAQSSALQLVDSSFAAAGTYVIPMIELDSGFDLEFRARISTFSGRDSTLAVNFGQILGSSREPKTGTETGLTVEFLAGGGSLIRVNSVVLTDSQSNEGLPRDGNLHHVRILFLDGVVLIEIDGIDITDGGHEISGLIPNADDFLKITAYADHISGLARTTTIDDVNLIRRLSDVIFRNGFE